MGRRKNIDAPIAKKAPRTDIDSELVLTTTRGDLYYYYDNHPCKFKEEVERLVRVISGVSSTNTQYGREWRALTKIENLAIEIRDIGDEKKLASRHRKLTRLIGDFRNQFQVSRRWLREFAKTSERGVIDAEELECLTKEVHKLRKQPFQQRNQSHRLILELIECSYRELVRDNYSEMGFANFAYSLLEQMGLAGSAELTLFPNRKALRDALLPPDPKT